MVKTYSPFIELTRTDEVEGLSTISLINVDDITLIRCLDDGRAEIFFRPGYLGAAINTPQSMIPVETYAFRTNALTELTQIAAQPAKKKRRPARKKP
jgi:hypothetical protein